MEWLIADYMRRCARNIPTLAATGDFYEMLEVPTRE